jgi:3,4-dihydroxy 2-butanone 4-phosphate synthase/GTP cyclohydrolase II
MTLAKIEEVLEDIRAGKMIVLVDDEDRENEGDLTIAAEHVTPETINFMARHGRGLICLSITEERARQLHLPPMVQDNSSPFGTAFTVSIEARKGVTTGISAHDRATTIRVAIAPNARPEDVVRRVTSSRSWRRRAAFSCGRGRPRGPSTWPVSPAAPRRASSARS